MQVVLAASLFHLGGLSALSFEPPDDEVQEVEPAGQTVNDVTPWGDSDAEQSKAEAVAPASLAPRGVTRRHGIEVFAGPLWIPGWYFSGPLAAFSTANCRNGVSSSAAKKGVVRNDGCNFVIGGQYIYRRSANLDISGTVEYRQVKMPDSMWIKRKDWGSGCTTDKGPDSKCDLGMADYVEADFSHLLVGADFTGRATLYRDPLWWLQLGGGGGFGLVIFTGKRLYQTPVGRGSNGRPGSPDGATCKTIADLGNFERCTPQWWDDPDTDQDGDGELLDDRLEDNKIEEQDGWVSCSKGGCSKRDLNALGSRERTFGPPVLALPKVYASARILLKETYGLHLAGGFNGGFFFGAGLQYFFGSSPQKP